MDDKVKDLIEKNVVAFATSSKDGKPNVIAVAYVKIKDNKIIITDNYMNKTKKNLEENNKVALVVWENDEGYQIKGTAKHITEGELLDFVKNLEENKDLPAKAAVVVTIEEVCKLA